MYYITFVFDSKVESILEEQVGKKAFTQFSTVKEKIVKYYVQYLIKF